MKGLIVQLIQDEYQSLLHLKPTLPAEAWSQAVTKANPILFYLNDGAPLIQIGEASRQSLLAFLRQEFGSTE